MYKESKFPSNNFKFACIFCRYKNGFGTFDKQHVIKEKRRRKDNILLPLLGRSQLAREKLLLTLIKSLKICKVSRI